MPLAPIRRLSATLLSLSSIALLAACSEDPDAPALPHHLEPIIVLEQSAVVGTVMPQTPGVRVVSENGRPVVGIVVSFTTIGGGVVAAERATTDRDGLATTERWTLGTRAGSQSVRAEAPGLEPVLFTATARPGSPMHITPTAGMNQMGPAGALLPVAPAVTIRDAHGNPIVNLTLAFAVQSGGGAILGAIATTNDQGVATAGAWRLGPTLGTQRMAAIAGPLTATFEATATP